MNERTRSTATLPRMLRRTAGVAVLAAIVVLGTMPRATLAASPAAAHEAVTPREPKVRVIKSVQDAVAKHLLDPDVLAALDRDGRVDTLVVFDGSEVRRDADVNAGHGKDRKTKLHSGLKAGHDAQKAKAFKNVKGVKVLDQLDETSIATVRFTRTSGLLKVLARPDVRGIALPKVHKAQLDKSLGLIRQPAIAQSGYKGAGTTIAVLDTGVDYRTGAFGTCPTPGASGCRVIEALDFAPNDSVLDSSGHGTNVAAIAAAVAPGARILAYDVFDGAGANWQHVVAAINRAITLQATYNVRAINMSLGSGRYIGACPTIGGVVNPYAEAFLSARAVGIVPVVATGNDARLDNGAFGAGIAFPACTPGAVSVGAVYDSSFGSFTFVSSSLVPECTDASTAADKVTCFSQSSPIVTVLAPGSQINAAGLIYSGTSQAAPHVAGAAAVLAAARPTATVDAITAAIANTGTAVGDPRPGAGQKRRLDLYAAVVAITSVGDTTKPVFAANPTSAIDPGYTLATNGLTAVTFAWKATDASGIARYNLSLRANGGAWVDYTSSLPTPTTESLDFNLTPGVKYEVAVVAQDKAGNWGDWRLSAPVTVGLTAENGAGVSYVGAGWSRVAWASAVGGNLTVGATPNAYARFVFTGKSIAWVGSSDTNRGEARVYLDGVHVATVDMAQTTPVARKVQFLTAVDPSRSHTLDIQVVGTLSRPTVDVDAFVVLR